MSLDMPTSRRGVLKRSALLAGGLVTASAVSGAAPVGALAGVGNGTPHVHRPWVWSRHHWRARPPVQPAEVLDNGPVHIVVHHTASPNQQDTSWIAAGELSRAIQDLHMDTNGWDDSGQQLTISRGGHIMEGRNRSLEAIESGRHVMGAHTLSYNETTIGIENEGTYMEEEPPDVLLRRLIATCAWLCDVYQLDPETSIFGHRDYNDTLCPGDTLYALLPTIRAETAQILERGNALRGVHRSTPPSRSHASARSRTPETKPFDHGPALGPDEHA